MNTKRLIQDIQDCCSDLDVLKTNVLDTSLALACNLITNCLGGDLSEKNLYVFLDRFFIETLLSKRIVINGISGYLSAFHYGLLFLQTHGEIDEVIRSNNVASFGAMLAITYQAALPVGSWDEFIAECPLERKNHLSQTYLDILRPDTSVLRHNDGGINQWLLSNGFFEIPLYRSTLRKKCVKGNSFFESLSQNKIGYLYQEISHSTPPKEDDLFYANIEFSRWICIPGAVIIYKLQELHDLRWIRSSTVISFNHSVPRSEGRILISLGALSRLGTFIITISGANSGEDRIIKFEEAIGVCCEIRMQKWVDNIRVTIDSDSVYVVNVDVE